MMAAYSLVRTFKETGHTEQITKIVFGPDGTLVSASYDKSVIIRSAKSGDIQRTITTDTKGLTSLALSKDGKFLAAGGAEGPPAAAFLYVWDFGTGEAVEAFGDMTAHFKNRSYIFGLAFSSDSNSVAACTDDGDGYAADGISSINVFDLTTKKYTGKFSGHHKQVNDLAISGDLLVSVSNDKSVQYWDLRAMSDDPAKNKPTHSMKGHTGKDGCICEVNCIGDLKDQVNPDCPVKGHSSEVLSVLFTEDGKFVVSVAEEVIVWDADGKFVRTMAGIRNKQMKGAALFGNIIAVARERTIQLWNIETGEAVGATLESEDVQAEISALAFSPDGQLAASAKTTMYVWASGGE